MPFIKFSLKSNEIFALFIRNTRSLQGDVKKKSQKYQQLPKTYQKVGLSFGTILFGEIGTVESPKLFKLMFIMVQVLL